MRRAAIALAVLTLAVAAMAADIGGTRSAVVNLATSVTGELPDANVSNTLTASILVGSGSTTNAVDLATAEVAGTLAVGNGGTGATSLAGAGLFTTANDGSGSGLDADLLDGISSAAFCQLGSCTMTSATVYSGVSEDITSTAGEDLEIAGGGTSGSTGSTVLSSRDNQIDVQDSSNNVRGQIIVSTSQAVLFARQSNSSTSGSLALYSATAYVGSQTDVGSTTLVGGFGESMGLSSVTTLFGVYGGGLFGVPTQQSITISTGTDTTTPTSSHVELTCTTPACTYSPGETSIPDGARLKVCNVDGSDNISIATSAGVVVVTGSPRVLTPGECADCTYSGAIWGCT